MSREEVLKNLEEFLKFEIDEKELSPELRKKIGEASLILDRIHSISNEKDELEKLKPIDVLTENEKYLGYKIIGDKKYKPFGSEQSFLISIVLTYIIWSMIDPNLWEHFYFFILPGFIFFFIVNHYLIELMRKDFWPREAIQIENYEVKEKISQLEYQISNWKNEYDTSLKVLAQEIFDELSLKEKLPRGAIFNIGTLTHIEDRSQTISIKDSVIQRSQIGSQEGETEVSNSMIQKSKVGNLFQICPFCGAKLDLPRTPRYCPYCREELRPDL